MQERIPPAVVAALTAALAAYLESEPDKLQVTLLRGPVPRERWDAGLYGEVGLLLTMAKRQGGGRR